MRAAAEAAAQLACEAQQVPDRLRLPFLSICASIIICIQCVCTSIFTDLVHRLQLISDVSTQAAQAVVAPDSLAALEFWSAPPDRFGPGIHSSGPG